jgi:hypothetical protein
MTLAARGGGLSLSGGLCVTVVMVFSSKLKVKVKGCQGQTDFFVRP